ncbi:MAG: hypothetical protein V4568_10390 [Pseudomonadota bacterium]
MATIIAGMFDTITKAEAAVHDLREGHCRQEDISTFHNNPPGQHDTFPVGGDEDADPGAKDAHAGAAAGAAIGAGLGLAAIAAGPLAVAAAVGVGAYTGALGGALSGSGDSGNLPARRPAGVMVAVNATGVPEQSIAQILRQRGASVVEKADGEWRDGQWADFDPLAVPRLMPDESAGAR